MTLAIAWTDRGRGFRPIAHAVDRSAQALTGPPTALCGAARWLHLRTGTWDAPPRVPLRRCRECSARAEERAR